MFRRKIQEELGKWAASKDRKPLVLRGARQVGKTTIVGQFAANYKQFISFNLELQSDKEAFLNISDFEGFVQSLFLMKNKSFSKRADTLLFIDEIQEVPEAFNLLRFFYERMPELSVVVAGSMLETLFNSKLSFPVGRVDYLVVRPVSFYEFLGAIGEEEALEQLNIVPFNDFAFTKLIGLYHLYALLGGMPEVIKKYAETRDITALNKIYNSLITSYLDDVEKYAHSNNQVQAIRHAIKASFFEAGKRIKFQGFGKSNYGSKEMGEALRTLEKAFILSLLHPTTGTKLPIIPDYKKSPRLQLLDTGLLNYMVGLQKDLLGSNDLNAVYQGTLIEHLVGQELISDQYETLASLNFWVREKNTSSAEIDYLINYEGHLIPIEVKAGKEGKLKSLHLFMDETPGNIAVRFYAGKISITEVKTAKGKEFKLLNLPYFLAGKVREYLDWMGEL